MTTMVVELYDALITAGAPEEKAKLAARAITERDDWIVRLEAERNLFSTKSDLEQLRSDLQAFRDEFKQENSGIQVKLAALSAEVGVLRWMMGGTFLSVILILIKAFLPHG